MPPKFGIGMTLHGMTPDICGDDRIGKLVAARGRAFGREVTVRGSEEPRTRAAGAPLRHRTPAKFGGAHPPA